MSKQRAITGFGPTQLTITASTAGTATGNWVRFGPFIGNTLGAQLVFSATSAGETATLQGVLAATISSAGAISAASTSGIVGLVTRSSTELAQVKSTSALAFAFLRLLSTDFTGTVTAHIAAVP